MSNYKKFDLSTIKKKLVNGEYASRVGAMRAIGKTQGLSEGEREKARTLVSKHFGEEPTPPPAKKASKKAAKKAAPAKKKAAKKAAPARAKKASKKGGRRAKAQPADDGAGTTEAPKAKPVSLRAGSTAPVRLNGKSQDVTSSMGSVISTVSAAIQSMETAKKLFPKAELETNVEKAAGVMTRAVQVIDQEVVRPMLNEDSTTAPSSKKSTRRGTRTRAARAAAPPPASNGEGTHELSEEEQLAAARETQGAVNNVD